MKSPPQRTGTNGPSRVWRRPDGSFKAVSARNNTKFGSPGCEFLAWKSNNHMIARPLRLFARKSAHKLTETAPLAHENAIVRPSAKGGQDPSRSWELYPTVRRNIHRSVLPSRGLWLATIHRPQGKAAATQQSTCGGAIHVAVMQTSWPVTSGVCLYLLCRKPASAGNMPVAYGSVPGGARLTHSPDGWQTVPLQLWIASTVLSKSL